MNKFWNWKTINNTDETTGETITERELRIEGIIAEESWFDDDVTPKLFRNELNAGSGNITVWVNSYGGDVFAHARPIRAVAVEMYLLRGREKPGLRLGEQFL